MALDMLSFKALLAGSKRINAAHTVTNTWLNFVASQGSRDSVKKLLSGATEDMGSGNTDQEAFNKTYGGGF